MSEANVRILYLVKEEKYVLLIVMAVASLAIFTFFTSSITTSSEESLTGAAVKGQIATLCKDSDASNAEKKGIVNIFFGSRFPDQCYDDNEASEDPVNNGRYLRETICEDNEPSYKVYDCGKNKCQYGACVTNKYVLME